LVGADRWRLFHPEERAAVIASRQQGIVTRAQLFGAGFRKGAVDGMLARGRLHAVHRGVYLLGHPVPPPLAREFAAVLACGRGAVLSHAAAGAVWGFHRRGGDEAVDVTVTARNCRPRPGIRTHRVASLHSLDRRRRNEVPITAPARTLLDLAAVLHPNALERAVAEATASHLVRMSDLRDALDRAPPGRPGSPALRALIDDPGGAALTRSEAEARALALIRRAGLPAPEANVRVGGFEVDLYWRDAGLIVEIDGFAYHSSRSAFERDRDRDARLQLSGNTVIRITWRQLETAPEAVVATLARALAH
jgi:very-short-patch-repair endonuclease